MESSGLLQTRTGSLSFLSDELLFRICECDALNNCAAFFMSVTNTIWMWLHIFFFPLQCLPALLSSKAKRNNCLTVQDQSVMIKAITTSLSCNHDRAALLAAASQYEEDGKLLLALRAHENAFQRLLGHTTVVESPSSPQNPLNASGSSSFKSRQSSATASSPHRGAATTTAGAVSQSGVGGSASSSPKPVSSSTGFAPRPPEETASSASTFAAAVPEESASHAQASSVDDDESNLEQPAEELIMRCNQYCVHLLRDEDDSYSARDALLCALSYLVTESMLQPLPKPGSASAVQPEGEHGARTAPLPRGAPPAFVRLHQPPQLPNSVAQDLTKRLAARVAAAKQSAQVESPKSTAGAGASKHPRAPPSLSQPPPFPTAAPEPAEFPASAIQWSPAVRARLLSLTLNNFGCVARHQKLYADAAQLFRAAAQCDPSGFAPLPLMQLALVENLLDHRQEAIDLAKYVVKIVDPSKQASPLLPPSRSGPTKNFRWQAEIIGLAYHALAIALEPQDGNASCEAYKNAISRMQSMISITTATGGALKSPSDAAAGASVGSGESNSALSAALLRENPVFDAVEHNYRRYDELLSQLRSKMAPVAAPSDPAGSPSGRTGAASGSSGALSMADAKRSFRRQQQAQQNAAVPAQPSQTFSPLHSPPSAPNIAPEVPKHVWPELREVAGTSSVFLLPQEMLSITEQLQLQNSMSRDAPLSGSLSRISSFVSQTVAPLMEIPSWWLVVVETSTAVHCVDAEECKASIVPAITLASMPVLSPRPPGDSAGHSSRPGRKRSVGANAADSGAEGSGGQHTSGSSPSRSGPPKPVALINPELLAEEAKKRDDVVSFMASRLTQLLKIEEYHNSRHAAAIRIQWFVRPLIARRVAALKKSMHERAMKLLDLRRRAAVARLVRFFKRVIALRQRLTARSEALRIYARKRQSAIIVFQKYTRRWNAIRLAERLRKRRAYRGVCAAQIQRWIRGRLAVRLLRRLRSVCRASVAAKVIEEREDASASRIISSYRAHRARIAFLIATGHPERALRLDRQKYWTRAATTIQRYTRGHLCRLKTNRAVRPRLVWIRNRLQAQRLNQAAVMVQRNYRAHRVKIVWCKSIDEAKQRGREKYAKHMAAVYGDSAVKIQAVARGFLSRRRHRRAGKLPPHPGPSNSNKSLRKTVDVFELDDEEHYFIGMRPGYGEATLVAL